MLFLDGDCVLPRDHVRIHLERRKPGTVMAGDFCRLDEETSRRVTPEAGSQRRTGGLGAGERLRDCESKIARRASIA